MRRAAGGNRRDGRGPIRTMITTTLWVALLVLVGLVVAALVAKLFVRASRGPVEVREAERRKRRFAPD